MEISTRKEKHAIVVSIKGRMDAISSPGFEKQLSELMGGEEKDFVVDFGELDYISSAGLRSVLTILKDLQERNGKLLLCSLKDLVKHVFTISGLSAVIPIYETVDSALSDLRTSQSGRLSEKK
jgi:anti-anti-sigma factor